MHDLASWSRRGIILGSAIVMLFLALFLVNGSVQWLDAKKVMVIQYLNGSLRVVTEPGPVARWFGSVTEYHRRTQFTFDNDKTTCSTGNSGGIWTGHPPMRIRFAEGGHATICGELSFEIPISPERLIKIQKDFGSEEAMELALVKTSLTNAVYLAGQTMTSTESSAERRADLLHYIEDQMKHGVYKTTRKERKEIDPLTKQERMVTIVEIVRDEEGKAMRQNQSAFEQYGLQLVQTSLSEIKYEDSVEAQIKAQQKSKAEVQIAIANALKAEQDARTVAEQGKAEAAKTEWAQRAIMAKEVTKAEQEKAVAQTHATKLREVAKLEKEAAEFTKQKDILLGQGESEKRRLILAADGALEKKLEAWLEAQKAYAKAMADYKGQWVPTTVMGSSGGGVNGGLALVDLLTAKTARDLQLDMAVKK